MELTQSIHTYITYIFFHCKVTQSLGYLDNRGVKEQMQYSLGSLTWTDSPSPVFSPSQFLVDQGTPLVVVVTEKAGAFVGEEVRVGGCKQTDELMFLTCLLIHSFSVFSSTS